MFARALMVALLFSGAAADFDAELARLKQGHDYQPAAKGQVTYRIPIRGVVFETLIDVPETYDPARKWPVRVQLHGGVNRPLDSPRRRGPNGIAGSAPQIYVYPRAWSEAMWWQGVQVDNILAVLDKLKGEYNVDESRVYVTGFSDGGTGAFFFGMREATPFAVIAPLHGNLAVLANPRTGVDGQMYPGNLANRPMFATNGGRDPLYPAAAMAPLIEMVKRSGVELQYRRLDEAGHEMSWWPAEREGFERFVDQHPRVPHPARLSWETERTDRYNRVDWLIINELGTAASDERLEDVGESMPAFARRRPSGRVDVVRNGNTFEAHTRGVKAFTLLLSPDVVDFGKPVNVVVNKRPSFNGTVKKDSAVLQKWAARDRDRTMLYGAELRVEVK